MNNNDENRRQDLFSFWHANIVVISIDEQIIHCGAPMVESVYREGEHRETMGIWTNATGRKFINEIFV